MARVVLPSVMLVFVYKKLYRTAINWPIFVCTLLEAQPYSAAEKGIGQDEPNQFVYGPSSGFWDHQKSPCNETSMNLHLGSRTGHHSILSLC